MIKFNDDNIYVGHIKELLHSFNLPVCKVKKEDSKFYVGEFYLDKDLEDIRVVTSVDSSNNLLTSEKIRNYKYNDEILNLTKHLEIRNNYYDSYTHIYLGNYLRFIKDYLGLDLMSMYNCFTNESPVNIDIEIRDKLNTDYVIPVSTDDDYNIFMIPVRANTTYTISFEYLNTFSVFCGFYSHNKYIQMFDTPSDNVNSIEAQSFKTFDSGCTAAKPMLYTTPSLTTEEEIRQERNLKLFICLPVSYTDNIVILEGDYTKNTEIIVTENNEQLGHKFFEHIPGGISLQDNEWYFNDIDTGKDSSVYVDSCDYNKDTHRFTIAFSDSSFWISPYVSATGNYDFITRNQLLEFQTHTKYLLADRLQEYLSDNVITHVDEIINNIKRVQILLSGLDSGFTFSKYGIWSEDINKWIYKYISTHGKRGDSTYRDIYRDVLCFVDKDIESILLGLKLALEKKKDKTPREIKALKVLEDLGGIYA